MYARCPAETTAGPHARRGTPQRRQLPAIAIAAALLAGAADAAATAVPGEADVLTAPEAASLLRVDASVLQALAANREIPGRRVGGEWRFRRSALLAWLDGGAARPRTSLAGEALPDWDLGAIVGTGQPGREAPGAPAPQPIGDARPDAASASEISLRGQDVLLRRGELGFELGSFYTQTSEQRIAWLEAGDGALVPSLVTFESESLSSRFTARYAFAGGLQLTGSLPFSRTTRAIVVNEQRSALDSTTEWGDLDLGVRWQAWPEGAVHPAVILSADAHVPVGSNAYRYGLGAGIALVKSIDPAALFASINYRHNAIERDSDAVGLQPASLVSATLGYSVALNDRLTLNTSVTGSFVAETEYTTMSLPEDQRLTLNIGLTSLLGRRFYVEPTLSFDLTGTGRNVSFGLNLPVSF